LVREVVDDQVTKPSVITTRAYSGFLKRRKLESIEILSMGKYWCSFVASKI
jgi:hypothetical protein